MMTRRAGVRAVEGARERGDPRTVTAAVGSCVAETTAL